LYDKHKADTVEYLVDFLALMIESAKLKDVILVGNSLGGHIAIRYAHKYPGNVAGLVLTGSSGLYENTQSGSYLKRSNYTYIKERVAATFYDPAIATDELVTEVMQATTNTYKCLCMIKAAKSAQRDNVLTRLADIRTPVLLIWGNDDRITPLAVAYQFKNNLLNSKLVVLAECGHAPMMEKPEVFNAALAEFLG